MCFRLRTIPRILILIILSLLALLLIINSSNKNGKNRQNLRNPYRKNSYLVKISKDTRKHLPILISHMTWTKNENVLDYGCGDGAVSYHLILPKIKEMFGHLYAVDIMFRNLERAKRLYRNPHVTFASGNLLGNTTDQFPYLDLRFDKIFAINVFHFVHDLYKLLERFWYLLTPNGQIGFVSLTEQAIECKVTLSVSRLPVWSKYLANFESTFCPSWSMVFDKKMGDQRRKAVEIMFKVLGFRIKFLEFGNVTSFHEDVDSLIESWFWESPIYDNVPEELLPDLKLELKRQFSTVTKMDENSENFSLTQMYIMGVIEKEERAVRK